MFGVDKIQNFLPHRYPFLLIDRVIECEPGKRLLGLKNISVNEPWVSGHFPSKAIFPGVLIIEALAQATGLLASETAPELVESGMIYYLVGVDKVRFKKPVYPGDQLLLEVEYLRHKRNIWSFECTALVEGKAVASAQIMCAAAEP
ncbi:MAG: 3-hydroxyacyl-ACP dehydratase FabZ [Gammaproteobacteria bacterium]|nr:3-hydroxyacyl-ACP dehydratase FabZ [Gammaproteobacteria bacterium]